MQTKLYHHFVPSNCHYDPAADISHQLGTKLLQLSTHVPPENAHTPTWIQHYLYLYRQRHKLHAALHKNKLYFISYSISYKITIMQLLVQQLTLHAFMQAGTYLHDSTHEQKKGKKKNPKDFISHDNRYKLIKMLK